MMIGTKEAAALLNIRPGTLTKAVWEGRVSQPTKAPGGAFVWSEADLHQAAWVLLGHDINLRALAKALGADRD